MHGTLNVRYVSRVRLLTCVLLVGLALAGCGDESDTSDDNGASKDTRTERTPDVKTEAQPPPAEPKCRNAKRALISSLQDTLTDDRKLRNASYVEVDDPPDDPPLNGFSEGVYIVSARASDETLSWAVSEEMLKTGGGAGLGVDEPTLEASQLGAAAAPGSPAADYTDALRASEAYDRARECAAG